MKKRGSVKAGRISVNCKVWKPPCRKMGKVSDGLLAGGDDSLGEQATKHLAEEKKKKK